jgi:hypothetical protein
MHRSFSRTLIGEKCGKEGEEEQEKFFQPKESSCCSIRNIIVSWLEDMQVQPVTLFICRPADVSAS